jgi:hypothetical protein
MVAWREDERLRRDGGHVAIGGRRGNNHIPGWLAVEMDRESQRVRRRVVDRVVHDIDLPGLLQVC